MTPRARRALFTVVLFFAVCAVAGQRPAAQGGGAVVRRRKPASRQPQVLRQCLRVVEQNYAEPIDGDKADAAIYDGAIPGMLRVLRSALQFLRSQGLRQACARSSTAATTASAWSSSSRIIRFTSCAPRRHALVPAGIHPGDVIARSTAKAPTAGHPTRWPRRSRDPRARTCR
jgi:hypothetical protein